MVVFHLWIIGKETRRANEAVALQEDEKPIVIDVSMLPIVRERCDGNRSVQNNGPSYCVGHAISDP